MRKILVIIDMQNDFITGALGSEEAQKILPSVLQYAQNFSGEILFTKDTHQPNYLESREGKKLPIVHCVEKTLGWESVSYTHLDVYKRQVRHCAGYLKDCWTLSVFSSKIKVGILPTFFVTI